MKRGRSSSTQRHSSRTKTLILAILLVLAIALLMHEPKKEGLAIKGTKEVAKIVQIEEAQVYADPQINEVQEETRNTEERTLSIIKKPTQESPSVITDILMPQTEETQMLPTITERTFVGNRFSRFLQRIGILKATTDEETEEVHFDTISYVMMMKKSSLGANMENALVKEVGPAVKGEEAIKKRMAEYYANLIEKEVEKNGDAGTFVFFCYRNTLNEPICHFKSKGEDPSGQIEQLLQR